MHYYAECLSNYAVAFDHNAEEGRALKQISDVDGCAAKCNDIQDCVAFDFDRSDAPYKDSRCWIHDSDDFIKKKQAEVDHYTKRGCNGNVWVLNITCILRK